MRRTILKTQGRPYLGLSWIPPCVLQQQMNLLVTASIEVQTATLVIHTVEIYFRLFDQTPHCILIASHAGDHQGGAALQQIRTQLLCFSTNQNTDMEHFSTNQNIFINLPNQSEHCYQPSQPIRTQLQCFSTNQNTVTKLLNQSEHSY